MSKVNKSGLLFLSFLFVFSSWKRAALEIIMKKSLKIAFFLESCWTKKREDICLHLMRCCHFFPIILLNVVKKKGRAMSKHVECGRQCIFWLHSKSWAWLAIRKKTYTVHLLSFTLRFKISEVKLGPTEIIPFRLRVFYGNCFNYCYSFAYLSP